MFSSDLKAFESPLLGGLKEIDQYCSISGGLPPPGGAVSMLMHVRPLVYWCDPFRRRWAITQSSVSSISLPWNASRRLTMACFQSDPPHWFRKAYVQPPKLRSSSSPQKYRVGLKLRLYFARASFARRSKSSAFTSPSTKTSARLARGPQCSVNQNVPQLRDRRNKKPQGSAPILLL